VQENATSSRRWRRAYPTRPAETICTKTLLLLGERSGFGALKAARHIVHQRLKRAGAMQMLVLLPGNGYGEGVWTLGGKLRGKRAAAMDAAAAGGGGGDELMMLWHVCV